MTLFVSILLTHIQLGEPLLPEASKNH